MPSYCEFDLVHHGGYCCGIKIIKGFGGSAPGPMQQTQYNHYNKVDERQKAAKRNNRDQNGADTSSAQPFFTDAAPMESYEDRLNRYLAFVDKHRPYGIVEITMVSDQMNRWWTTLKALGFVIVSSCRNSNSGRRVYVLHRRSDDGNSDQYSEEAEDAAYDYEEEEE